MLKEGMLIAIDKGSAAAMVCAVTAKVHAHQRLHRILISTHSCSSDIFVHFARLSGARIKLS